MPVTYKVQKGDTLNSIAQRYGYSNYKDAGISSVPSGNFDLIRPDEEITIGNAKSGVGDIKTTPIVTSQDVAQGFKEDSNSLDSIINAPKLEDDPTVEKDETKKDGKTGNELFDNYRKSADDAKLKADEEAEEVLGEYDSLYKLELAAVDARTRSTINSLKQSFSQRIQEQKRINKVNVDRVKAYGLGSGAAQYTPIAWTDAITERERKGAEEVQGLEIERQNLIDAAKAAKEESNAALLSQKIKDYNAVKDKLNQKLKDIEAESKAQYEALRTLREEQEADFKEKQAESLKRLQAYYTLNTDEIENLSDDEKEALVNQIAGKYGFETYEVLGVLDQAVMPNFERLQAEADLERTKAQTQASKASAGSSEASAAAAYALAAQRRKETEKMDEENPEDKTYSTTELNKLRQAGLQDADQQTKDDYLYGDEFAKQEALDRASGGGSSGGGDVKSRASNAGYDYDAMRAAGYSDEDIKSALEAAGA